MLRFFGGQSLVCPMSKSHFTKQTYFCHPLKPGMLLGLSLPVCTQGQMFKSLSHHRPYLPSPWGRWGVLSKHTAFQCAVSPALRQSAAEKLHPVQDLN